MNIILINHYAGSAKMGMEFRPYYMAREWVKAGYNVTIVAGDYSHLRKINPKVGFDFQEEEIDGIIYCWMKAGAYSGNGVKRAFSMFRFVGKLWLHAGIIAKKYHPDIVIASSTYPLDTFAAQKIVYICERIMNKIGGVRLIHEVHDMWPITPMEMYGMKAWHPFIVLLQWAENSFCKHSDRVVSILPYAKDYLVEHGMKPDKFCFIPNGIVLDDWENPEQLPLEHQKLIDKARQEGRFILVFFGSHTKSYNIDTLLKAGMKCNQEKFLLLFVGDGTYRQELIEMSKQLIPGSVAFMPSIPKKAIPSLISASDGSYVGAIKNRMFRFGIGMNKMFDAMMSGKPILYAVNAPNNYIEEYGCGICVESENIDALAEGLTKMMNLSESERDKMGENGRKAIIEHYSYEKVSSDFMKMMNE